MCTKRVVQVSLTPIVLSYFAERKKGIRQEITRVVFDVASRLLEVLSEVLAPETI